jgi:hypothetical protein
MKVFDIDKIAPILPIKKSSQTCTFPSICDFLTQKDIALDLDVYLEDYGMNLQRGFVWNELQKREFILSILKKVPITPITAVVVGDNADLRTYKIIDGKQRISTLISFVKNEFPIPCDGEEFYYEELPADIKRIFYHYEFEGQKGHSHSYSPIPDKVMIQWFKLLNFAGTQQEEEHIEKLTNLLKK